MESREREREQLWSHWGEGMAEMTVGGDGEVILNHPRV